MQKRTNGTLKAPNIEWYLKTRPEVLITKVGDRELHRWTKASFAARTGIKNPTFRANHATNEVI